MKERDFPSPLAPDGKTVRDGSEYVRDLAEYVAARRRDPRFTRENRVSVTRAGKLRYGKPRV